MVDLTGLLDKVYTKWGIFDFENIKKRKMASASRLAAETDCWT